MPLIQAGNVTFNVAGSLIKIGAVHDEEWLEIDALRDPEALITNLRKDEARIDIFCFSQKMPETTRKYSYYMEWDNIALAPVTTFAEWWAGLPQATRKNVRRSAKRGVEVRVAEFNDEFVRGIADIYNETAVRQGRRFWHYGKDFDTIKKENSTYLANCDFVGAYLNEQLIGFIKTVYVGNVARIMQIISMVKHQDKRPTNALIAKAMETCEKRQMKYLIYGKYIYGKRRDTSIIEFKNRNGFKMVEIPRYYIPMSSMGKMALKLGLHHGITGLIPERVNDYLTDLRARWYERDDRERDKGYKNTN